MAFVLTGIHILGESTREMTVFGNNSKEILSVYKPTKSTKSWWSEKRFEQLSQK